jgi:hypothetical protein
MKQDYPSESDFEHAAWLLKCDVPAIKAVAEVEAGPNGAFLDSEEPVILFEPHVFHRLTKGKWDGSRLAGNGNRSDDKWREISYPRWRKGWYGPVSVQHKRLQFAVTLDRTAALKSCSWGLFQIMGHNHKACNYDTIQRFVTAMYRGVGDHLLAFCQFIRHDSRLVDALRNHDWKTFKKIYNGPGENDYAERMDKAYKGLVNKS